MTLYSENVKRIIQSYDWPPGNRLKLEIVEEVDSLDNPVLVLKMFRENFILFDGVEQMRIAQIMNDLIPRLISSGVPTRLEVAKGDGQIERA